MKYQKEKSAHMNIPKTEAKQSSSKAFTKQEGDDLKKYLQRIYGERIKARAGKSSEYSFSIDKEKETDIVVYLNYFEGVVVVWNNRYRNQQSGTAHCFNYKLCQEHKEEKISHLNGGKIYTGYREFDTAKERIPESVLLMSWNTFSEFKDRLYDLLIDGYFNAEEEIDEVEIMADRGKSTVLRWNREQDFREKILSAFDYKCAVCRCDEEKILEAAHIRAVSEFGSDDVENGICLCRNHHKMFDEKLIEIDFKTMTLSYVAESVKNMAWYSEYKENGSTLLKRVKE